ncbi:hypothetical protein B2J93_1535 [Marssonina coronariae]|uniref:Uncharacterized protein n=1 Tax=Diplocarpon coronariae TaxID=2795749 RepID=A0A218Z3I3_9HELO|nr:hypothetical protein B2J93_1535 [Marssonina coronariae]
MAEDRTSLHGTVGTANETIYHRMGGQRTFELIPTTLVKYNGIRRPMTSKAAKKAYQQANRGEKVSRAEQRRRDAAELEQQKKEYEKERAAARAKAARDKKAAKANAEKEARKKMGIPEPSKFVRASQPTISRFVRSGSKGKRSWQEMENAGEDSDQMMPGTEKDAAEPPAKQGVATEEDSENEFGDFPSLSQTDILEKIDSSIKNSHSALSTPQSPGFETTPRSKREPRPREASQELPTRKPIQYPVDDPEAIDEMVTTQLLSDLAEAVAKSDTVGPSVILSPEPRQQSESYDIAPASAASHRSAGVSSEACLGINPKIELSSLADSNSIEPAQPLHHVRSHDNAAFDTCRAVKPPLQERSTDMPPPCLPVKAVRSISFTPRSQSSFFLSHESMGTRMLPNATLVSTQAFLETHLDEFFPSPTQEIRELLDDVDDFPSNTQIAQELSPKMDPKTGTFDGLVCTQDCHLPPADLAEIGTPSREPSKLHGGLKDSCMPRPDSRESRRFFEEKDEDVLHAAIQESRALTAQESTEALKEITSLRRYESDSTDYGDLDLDSGDIPRLLREDEDKDLEAAILESKLLAAQEAKELAALDLPSLNRVLSNSTDGDDFEQRLDRSGVKSFRANDGSPRPELNLTAPKSEGMIKRAERRFFQEKEEDQIYAAVYESKSTVAQKLPPRVAPKSKPPKRTLKRVQSTATDYGDDDFSGCSQELLALC